MSIGTVGSVYLVLLRKRQKKMSFAAFIDEIPRVREELKLIGTKKVVVFKQLARQSRHNGHKSDVKKCGNRKIFYKKSLL